MRTWPSSRPRQSARPVLVTCGICVEVVTISCSSRGSHSASTPRPSIGAMHWREVRSVRVTLAAAMASSPTRRRRAASRGRCSSTSARGSAAAGRGAASMSATAGSASKSSSQAAARSSASARVAATQAAMASPTWRSLPAASAGCSERRKPGKAELARMGELPQVGSVKTRCRRRRAWSRRATAHARRGCAGRRPPACPAG